MTRAYYGDGTLKSATDAATSTTTYTRDAIGRVTGVTDGLNRTTTYAYDAAGNLVAEAAPGGSCTTATHCTTYRYSRRGELAAVTYSDPGTADVTNIEYDAAGRRTAMTDEATGTHTWTYDSLGRIASSTTAAGTIAYGYDRRNLRTLLTYPGTPTRSVTYTYDPAGRLQHVTDWDNQTFTYHYDQHGSVVALDYPNGTTTTATTDRADRILGVNVDVATSNLAAMVYGYDAGNRLTSSGQSGLPGPANQTFGYDELDQLTTVDGNTAYDYDAADNVVRNRDGTQTFDAANQLCWSSPTASSNGCGTPPSNATSYTYDTRGNRTATTDAAGSTTLSYDTANRLVGVDYGPLQQPTAGDLDAATYGSAPQAVYRTPAGGVERKTWNGTSWVTDAIPGGDHAIGDPAIATSGSNLTISYRDGSGISQSYWNGSTWSTGQIPGTTGALGDPSSSWSGSTFHVIYRTAADITTTYWTGSSWVTGAIPGTNGAVSNPGIAQYGSTFHVIYRTASGLNTTYWNGSAWITASIPATAAAVGDPDAASFASALQVVYRTAGGLNRLNWNGSSWTATAIPNTDDAIGDPTLTGAGSTLHVFYKSSSGVKHLTFDGTNWSSETLLGLVQAHAAYTYDGDGLRTTAAGDTGTASFVWDTAQGLPVILAENAARYVYGSDGVPLEEIDGGGSRTFYHRDRLGSIRLLTDQTGNAVGSASYDPYGLPSGSTGQTAAFGYAGQYTDTATGYQYLRARFYDPRTAQFLTRDPLDALTGARYSYADNNPVNNIDPLGLATCQSCANFAGGVLNGLSFGHGRQLLGLFGQAGKVRYCSGWYYFGTATGVLIQTALVGSALAKAAPAAEGEIGAYETAAAGGRHAGFLENYAGKSTAEIERGITSIEKQIAQHETWIENPYSKIANWDKLDPRQQEALINRKWPGDVQRQREQLDILRRILQGRR